MKRVRTIGSISGSARRLGAFALGLILLAATSAQADSLHSRQNIVDLIEYSEIILRGNVVEVTDGIDENRLPYTQVRVQVTETIRGTAAGEYTFRQFGLIAPRNMGDGRINFNVTPASWATYKTGEDVILFLYTAASASGLRTTVGLNQGKFKLHVGGAMSQSDNVGLFQDVAVDQSLLNDNDKRLMATKKGAVNADSFLSFVRRAVKDQWVERGKMRRAN